jgi:two-component system, cell cycle sensor histidine kinase and response regulator CckA
MNILIVDDQPINQKLLHATLEAEGHTVAEATNGVEALKLLEAQGADAIISDILMPRMDGYRLCSEVRKRKDFEHLPFIHYTATYVSPSDEKLSSDLGADAFLRKPARAEEIIDALRRVTSKEHKVRAISPIAETDAMKEYSERLVAKLEHKNLELVRALNELESERARLGHLLEHSPAVIYALKIEGQKVTPVVVSENIKRLLGVTVAEATQYEWWVQSLHPEDRDRVLAVLANSLTAGGYSTEYRIRHKDGSYHWVEDNNRVVCNETGQPKESVGVWTDITERKELEEQFIQSQKMEVVGHLAGGIAHDFNNILAVIFGYADLLMQKLDSNGPLRRYAEEVRYAADRAAALTRQLLVFSRKEALQPTVVDPNQLIKGLDKMLHRLINENIELTIELGEQIGRIKADSGYFGQVLMNLVVNARDALPNGGSISIKTSHIALDENYAQKRSGVTPGEYVTVSVTDTGIGMTEEVKAQLFKPFFTTKPKDKGTGLGLATCQTIVSHSGGHIEVESEVGRGTTFRIYFPQLDQPLTATTGPVAEGALPRGTETLLLVEDDPSLRHLALGILQAQGYEVLRATDGRDGLNLAFDHKGSPIRLVITDVVMPQMGGKIMADWLKTTLPEIKVLFTSGYTDDAVAHHGVLASGTAFLPKPYTPMALASKVREMIDAPV